MAAIGLAGILLPGWAGGQGINGLRDLPDLSQPRARVLLVHDAQATKAFEPNLEVVRRMVIRGITNLTGKSTPAAAWRSLLSTGEVVGIKVYAASTTYTGTRPAVVAAVVEGLLEAGISRSNLIVWDRYRADLRQAGFFDLAARYGIQVEGSVDAGFDEKAFYEPELPVYGPLVWSDHEFGKHEDKIGRRSFVSKLVTTRITKIINIAPLLNHNRAGVCGNLYSLALGSVDNAMRFEMDPKSLALAVPEIYNLPVLCDRVVLSMVDALICQYQGQNLGMLHYSAVLNELRFSKDPVALDVLSQRELVRQRKLAEVTPAAGNPKLFEIAAALELGINELSNIMVERVP
jgi:hypothetical protein